MELKGLKVNFLGDSITQGHGTSAPDKIYHALIKEKYGLAEARNYGIGGTRIAKQHNPTNEVWDQDFCKRCLEMDPDADLIVVFGGTNDLGHGNAEFGEKGLRFWLDIRKHRENYNEDIQIKRYNSILKSRSKNTMTFGAIVNRYRNAIDLYNENNSTKSN